MRIRIFRSLRARFFAGSLLWTLGLLALAHFLSLYVFRRVAWLRNLNHHDVMLVAIPMMFLGLLLVRRGLTAFDDLRERLSDVRDGRASRVEGEYPNEIAPLVHDLNELLAHREEAVRRALAKAGDLAHGLKTPLAILAQDSNSDQIEKMRRQIDYHLAHARAAASGATIGAHSSVLESVEGLARTLLRLHGRAIEVHVDREHAVRVQREDLDEILGNLLDNACKWSRTRVVVTSSSIDDSIVITVDDDGPGVDPSLRDVVLQRGVRADEAAPGSGFGLAIVRDLAELYGGAIALESAPIGGLRARLKFRSAVA
ncbi:MAG TPA: sensor histidine kinase [Thermoanaerobaculia bacterium]|nr:sensor histidine kinase [Thermoanaerobaculia bacterium]